ncbi:ABC transporter ATP-binding protein/permease [Methylocystis sp. MJC1]|jgi:putative ATP-binding cassette transporter|uniref:ABC transporter ATP-binding protein/permease n=1 Tax=Methylocystis sp. MJC1 TaxID=2654282 RepID=UPI0013EB306E|nr:ABC transporter ATP-binding protein/permease [Methylocystis sp. MJC1]KAF2991269.1 Vitamin B12 transport ATP-binding protein BacA [Methylocystis sp. MJC1]MBU6526192.1 ABC transporter ATP-binding protein/permease [Methylocystis sp. MJC1]UZX12646.1 ABC transporter ATP-binding protein/permease [Methylocystis sp. MJC1]
MRTLSAAVAAFAVLAALIGAHRADADLFILAVAAGLCAFTTWRGAEMSTFMKIFAAIFSTETIVFGLTKLLQSEELWPQSLADFAPPESMAVTVAVFSIIVYAVSNIAVVQEMTRIADLYFDAPDRGEARVWPLPRFAAREAAIAMAMIVVLVLINQGQVGISVRLSFFNRDWYNAIQERNSAEFWRQLLYVFTPWAFFYVAIAVIEYVLKSMLVIRWRRWLTEHYIQRWLSSHTHYGMTLAGGDADNPDQRIAEDVNRFIDGGEEGYGIYSYSILLISTMSSLVSFSFVLWELSGAYALPGTDIRVPGFLFWVALAYASLGTVVTHLIGRSLTGLFFEQQRREADFRFSLARLREYSEQVALLSGEHAEQGSLVQRFRGIVFNYLAIVRKRKQLVSFTASYGQLSPIIPYVITAPFYFAGKIQLGVMTQTASAFGRVESALTFFITYYTSLAQYKSVLDRLASFDAAIDSAEATRAHVVSRAPSNRLSLDDLTLSLPDGRRIVHIDALAFEPRQAALLTGPSGSGKSTLFRAIAGIWPHAAGSVVVPQGARVMLAPQRPYIPMGTLAQAVVYPADLEDYARGDIEEALRAARLAPFVERLDESNNWGQRLSGGEQQRVAIARALLAKPDWLFLDEATSALDEKLEGDIYRMLRERLPQTTIVSIGHRSTLLDYHDRQIEMEASADGLFAPRDKVMA